MGNNNTILSTRKRRLQNALFGLFIGDALAMPAHWYYNLDNIAKVFDGGINGYVEPSHPHRESFMVGMAYNPDLENAKKLGRDFDILHEHARFYNTSYSSLEIRSTDREIAHGNLVPQLDDRFHYHHGLKAGENTLAAHLVRVLMRSVNRCGRYDPMEFVEDFIEHMTTPGRNRDPYSEIYIRRWFENYSHGVPANCCAELQRNVWSIGSHGGIIRPLVISTITESAYQGLGFAIEHQNLTHRSENVASALGVLVPLLYDLLLEEDPHQTISTHGRFIRLPAITGEKLFATYRDHKGPGNIPKSEMWKFHTMLTDRPYEIDQFIREHSETEVIRHVLATACYPEHGLPLLLYLAKNHNLDVETTLLANANAGGDNVHRGMILGLIVGAASDELPEHLLHGLIAFEELQKEIEEFSDIALSGKGI